MNEEDSTEENEEIPVSPRISLHDILKEMLPDWNIISAPREADAVSRKTLLLWTGHASRPDNFKIPYLLWTIETWITVPRATDPGAFEENLDRALMEYLGALESLTSFTWKKAERGRLVEVLDGYRVEVETIYEFTE